jgi:hypothetical protein
VSRSRRLRSSAGAAPPRSTPGTVSTGTAHTPPGHMRSRGIVPQQIPARIRKAHRRSMMASWKSASARSRPPLSTHSSEAGPTKTISAKLLFRVRAATRRKTWRGTPLLLPSTTPHPCLHADPTYPPSLPPLCTSQDTSMDTKHRLRRLHCFALAAPLCTGCIALHWLHRFALAALLCTGCIALHWLHRFALAALLCTGCIALHWLHRFALAASRSYSANGTACTEMMRAAWCTCT